MPAPRIAYLDGPRLRRGLVAACDHAQRQRAELNRINVFPVPDGDTGTNLALTTRAIADHLRAHVDRSAGLVADAAAGAAVMGARGNCGMLLSHFLLGFAQGLEGRARVRSGDFVGALRAGVDRLYGALEKPVEGTILTVMRETAEEAEASDESDFEPLLARLVARAQDALARTPDHLPALRAAGVVDAGAKGFVALLEGALLLVRGDPLAAADASAAPVEEEEAAAGRADMSAERFRFCTEALVRGPAAALPDQEMVRLRLRDRLPDGHDSLIVIRSGDLLKLHVHTDTPEEVFAWLRSLGELVTHKAEDMRVQHEAVQRSGAAHVRLARRPIAVVSDSACDLPELVLRAHGIHVTPLALVDGDRVLKDGVDISAEAFHARLADPGRALPTTSQPAPADFLETWARAAEDGEVLLGVILGSTISGTFQSAQSAAARFRAAPVHLVDSLGFSLLEGMLALKAAELGELGTEPAAIVGELTRIRRSSGMLFTVDVFDRLVASGRVGRGRAWLGNVMSVKPILDTARDGKIVPAGKVRGRKRVLAGMIDALAARVPSGARKLRFGVVHIAAPEVLEPVTEAIRARWGRGVEVLTGPASPVLATHVGPGAWGLAYMVED